MSGFVGGTPERITSGGAGLGREASTVEAYSTPISQGKTQGLTGAGPSPVAAAITRFAAAYGTYVAGLATEIAALGKLASVSGADIAAVGGEHFMPGPGRPSQPAAS